ncbi:MULTISPECIES: xanthine dehydrogenase molybdopterin binding subunit [Halomonadaceae]|jgi:xanthine dehydrogenase large subunit|uniref:Xanthine dehydrogenase molybdenum-binding subunit XdhA n=1 Tax=Vreelandella titanicae TaxID=664683 RepID=A0A653S1X9_9GAMM|nr:MULTISPECIES: xanthine dehydrogenase molybdopterin binding subunit [Halomonas]QKS23692.1 Putative xanthine dehydrogenase molybdenum-binding subunit XdhA [Halomonas titanicae]CAD5257221.1 Xanthine dehydrogenase/oxidase [Halomonas sp. 156]CAD5292001.1 Xanthine dehydrogenase/oxidase [Halomonas sp. 113]CAD5293694.1 Xanthine dehydrogenase/oxidase [Halomonas sp. 59]CAD5296875.1 Xanthine dehydrogenase, molybdenum binding subunit [Halomonas sp. I3]
MRTLTKLDGDSSRARRELHDHIQGSGPLARHTGDSNDQRQAGSASFHESAEKHVTGKAAYIDDLVLPADALHVALGLSPVAHGTLTQLDLSKVKEAPGVVDVITFHEVPGHTDIGPVFPGDPIFVDQAISYAGQCLFAVAATSLQAARRAVKLAAISIDEQPASLDPVAATEREEFVRPTHVQTRGDWQQALDQAEQLIEGELFVGGQEHFYLEGQACVVHPTEDEGVVVHTSNQHPSETQKLVAEVLDIPFHAVTVEVRRMGGGFGGKETQASPWACIAAIIAHRTGKTVRLRLPRSEDMRATGKRHPFHNRYRLAIDAEGVIQGGEITVIGDCGYSPDLSDAIVDRAMFHADNAYSLGDAQVVGHRAKTHTASNTAFRGFGGPQGMMIIEAAMDDIARQIGEDPLTVRKRNFYRDGREVTHYGQQVDQRQLLHTLVETLESDSDYWTRRKAVSDFNATSPIIKKGLALTPVKFGISFTAQHLNQAGALLHVYTDGSVMINHGGTEMGQGLHTKICQVVARELGLDLEKVRITATRTDKVPNTSPTAASSGADLNGMAARDAASKLRERLFDFAAEHYSEGLDREGMRLEDGMLVAGFGESERRIPWGELVQTAYLNRISLSEKGFYATPLIHYDRSVGQGRPFYYYAFGAAVAEVSVDTLSGEYQVDRVDILHDVGDSLNPAIDIGQVEGGFIQGMGWLTSEELKWNDKGVLVSDGPATYKIPTFGDLPPVFNVALMEGHPNSMASLYRSKAVGEPPLMLGISVWSALRDALSSLTGYAISPHLDTPATPERVVLAANAIRKKVL